MAKAFYNTLTNSHDAEAAGTQVLEAGQTLLERKASSASKNFFVLDVMNDEGIDMSHYTRKPLTEDDIQRYDMIVNMAKTSDTPQWLLDAPNYIHWDITDPRGQNYTKTAQVRDSIKQNVKQLIQHQANK